MKKKGEPGGRQQKAVPQKKGVLGFLKK